MVFKSFFDDRSQDHPHCPTRIRAIALKQPHRNGMSTHIACHGLWDCGGVEDRSRELYEAGQRQAGVIYFFESCERFQVCDVGFKPASDL
jgi:hypothetical protein